MLRIGLLIALPIAYFQPDGSPLLRALALLVFAGVQLVESGLLTPKIMADRSGLHPAPVVISIFFWGTALGGVNQYSMYATAQTASGFKFILNLSWALGIE